MTLFTSLIFSLASGYGNLKGMNLIKRNNDNAETNVFIKFIVCRKCKERKFE